MPKKYAPRQPRVALICGYCGNDFTKHASAVATGRGIYCSRPCSDAAPSAPVPAIPCDDGVTARLPLHARDGTVRAYALIDAADAAWAQQWRWSMTAGYASRAEGRGEAKRTVLLHRALLGLVTGDGLYGDHINRDRLDDRRSNLRITTPPQSAQNISRPEGSSPYRGVTWDKARGKWLAAVTVDGRRHYLGRFTNEDEAAEAARKARATLMPFATE